MNRSTPLSIPRRLDVPWETRLLACSRLRDGRTPGIEEARRRKNGRKLFSRPALLFASSTLLRAFPTIWGPGTGYPVATWNAAAVTWETTRGGWVCRLQRLLLKHFWKTSQFSITVGITSPLNWLFGNPLIAWNLGNCSSVPVWAVLCVGFCLRACLHGGGGPQVVEVTRLGEVTFMSI